MGYRQIEVEVDAEEVLKLIQDNSTMQDYADNIQLVRAVRELIAKDWRIELNHATSDNNWCADVLAKDALRADLQCKIIEFPPINLRLMLFCDSMSASYPVLIMLASSMASSSVLFLLLLAFLASPCMSRGPYGPFFPSCSMTSNYTSGSVFEANLEQLLAALPKNAIKNGGFANDTAGAAPDTVYGLMMCLVDYSWDNCQNCLHSAASGIMEECPHAKTVSAAYTGCLVRYYSVPSFSTAVVGLLYYTTGYSYSDDPAASAWSACS